MSLFGMWKKYFVKYFTNQPAAPPPGAPKRKPFVNRCQPCRAAKGRWTTTKGLRKGEHHLALILDVDRVGLRG